MKTESRRVCSICGNQFSGALEFCPICIFRDALTDDIESEESPFENTSQKAAPRFEHYQLVKGDDGKPIELGHGAMGITYRSPSLKAANWRAIIAWKVGPTRAP